MKHTQKAEGKKKKKKKHPSFPIFDTSKSTVFLWFDRLVLSKLPSVNTAHLLPGTGPIK